MSKSPYRETISRMAVADYSHKKILGDSGRGEYARVKLRLEPLNQGDGLMFTSEIASDVLLPQWIQSVKKGVLDAAKTGVLNGGQVVGCRVTLFDGVRHDIDSSDTAFYQAAQEAFWQALRKAGPKLLLS
jgi:elongation factor G